MTGLADRQAAFLRAILDEGAPLPEGWSNRQTAGMAVYRGNYRSALMGALAGTYERTARYLGEKAFRQASINHAIKHPPSHWTIDAVGAGFDATCAQMFPDHPEAAELAWLEWSLLGLATAPNTAPIDLAAFGAATADFGDEEWSELRVEFQPRAVSRAVTSNLTAIWQALGDEEGERPGARLSEPKSSLVWREGERPTFILVEADHANVFTAMQRGATYGEAVTLLIGNTAEPSPEAVQNAAMRAGAMLGRWLQEGIVIGLNP